MTTACGTFNFITFPPDYFVSFDVCTIGTFNSTMGDITLGGISIQTLCQETGSCGCLDPMGGTCAIKLCNDTAVTTVWNDSYVPIATARTYLAFLLEETTFNTTVISPVLQPAIHDQCAIVFPDMSLQQIYCQCSYPMGSGYPYYLLENTFLCNAEWLSCRPEATYSVGDYLVPIKVIDEYEGPGGANNAGSGLVGAISGGVAAFIVALLLVFVIIRRARKADDKRKSRDLLEGHDIEAMKSPGETPGGEDINKGKQYISQSSDRSRGFAPGKASIRSSGIKSTSVPIATEVREISLAIPVDDPDILPPPPLPKSVSNLIVPPLLPGTTVGGTPMSRDVLRNTFMSYHTSDAKSKLSSVLRESFNGASPKGSMFENITSKKRPTSKSPNRSMPSVEEIISLKSKISKEEQKQFSKIKSISTKFSNDLGRLQSVFTVQTLQTEESGQSASNAASLFVLTGELAKKIIKQVCEKLDREVLSADEVAVVKNALSSRNHERSADKKNLGEEFSAGAPSISLEAYIQRLVLGLNAWFGEEGEENRVDSHTSGIRSLLIALIYLQRIKALEPNFTLTVFSVHRLFATMMLVAAKFCEDFYISSEYWAQVAGIEEKEVGYLEEQFCFSSGFNFAVVPADLLTLYRVYGVKEFHLEDIEAELRTTMGTQATDFSDLTESNPLMRTRIKKKKNRRKGPDGEIVEPVPF